MPVDGDKVNLVPIIPEISSFELSQDNGRVNNEVCGKTTARIDSAAEERQRTGRFLAVAITLVMVFIALYHTVMRHASVLAGLLAPAIIMLLYILWLLYFAKKRKPEDSPVHVWGECLFCWNYERTQPRRIIGGDDNMEILEDDKKWEAINNATVAKKRRT